MNDTQKIEEIKRIIESTDLSNFENLCSAMTEIIDVVYPKRQRNSRTTQHQYIENKYSQPQNITT